MSVFQLLLSLLPFRFITGLFHLTQVEPDRVLPIPDHKKTIVENTAMAIAAVARILPWLPVKCLGQALAGCFMLKTKKISATIVLGVQLKDQPTMAAHAWLKCGDIIVTGGDDNDEFKKVTGFMPAPFC